MTEKEYILATNIAKLRALQHIAGDLNYGENTGVTDEEFRKLNRLLAKIAGAASSKIFLDEDK